MMKFGAIWSGLRRLGLIGFLIGWAVLGATPSTAEALQTGTITVCPTGCEFSSIQQAIDAAEPGDTIEVGAGTYQESLTITKSLELIGAGQEETVIDGGGAKVVVDILADGIRFEGFEVRGQPQERVTVALVQLEGVHGVLLEENRLITPDQEIGLRLIDSYENQVINNVIEGEVPPYGPLLRGAHTGIYLKRSHANTLQRNRVTRHLEAGILLEDSDRNLIEENLISGNGMLLNNDTPEFVPVGGLQLVRSTANTVRTNRIESNENWGVLLKHSSLNRVEGNTITGEGHLVGLVLQGIADPEWREGNGSFGNFIIDNVIEGSWAAGLLVLNADGNVIRCNLIQQNALGTGLAGVVLGSWTVSFYASRWTRTQGNVIDGNTIRENRRGVMGYSMGGTLGTNTIRWNNIEGNELFGADYSGDLRWNWWGHPSGPYHPEKNPEGRGDEVSDGVEFVPWLESPVRWCD